MLLCNFYILFNVLNIAEGVTTNKKRKKAVVESEVTDSGVTDHNGFVTCKSRKTHHINFFGNPVHMIGRTFTVKSNRAEKFGFDMRKGKIAAVVRKPGKRSESFFKFYNLMEFPLSPPTEGSSSWCYKGCKTMLRTDKREVFIKWDALTKKVVAPRKKRSTFVMTYNPGNALYDTIMPPPVTLNDSSESSEEYDISNDGSSSDSSFTRERRVHHSSSSSDDDDNNHDDDGDDSTCDEAEKEYWDSNAIASSGTFPSDQGKDQGKSMKTISSSSSTAMYTPSVVRSNEVGIKNLNANSSSSTDLLYWHDEKRLEEHRYVSIIVYNC